jgi:peptidoglycan/LPS O-acetylase OafA/YrhL
MLQVWAKHWFANLSLSIACIFACLWMLGLTPIVAPAGRGLEMMLYAALYALAVWGATLGLIGAAVRFMPRKNRAIRYVADASYWIYIVHIPVLLVLQAALQPLSLPWFAKYPLTLAIAFAIMFVSYELFVRYSWIGAILNGRKQRPGKGASAPRLAAAE